MIFPIKVLADLGFEILATQGTAEVLRRNGVRADGRPQALRGPGPERRADHRAADPRRRDRPGHQHPARLVRQRRVGARRRLRDPHRGGDAPTSRASPPCRGSAPPCRASRRCEPRRHRRPLACRTGPAAVDGRSSPSAADDGSLPALFDHVLTRTDPERAHRAGFRAIRAGRPGARPRRRTPVGAPVQAMGLTFPNLLGPGRRLRQERRRHRRAGRARLRARRGRHGHRRAAARQPAAAAVPAARRPGGREPDGLQQRRRRGGRAGRLAAPGGATPTPGDRVRCSASTSARPRWCPRTTRRPCWPTTRRAPGCSRRTPTTSSSTSQLAQHPGAAQPAGRRAAASRC